MTKSEPVSDGGLFRSNEWHRLVLAGGSTPDKEVKQFRDFLLGSRTVPNSPLLALMVGRNYEKGVQKTKVVRGISRDGVPQFGEAVVWEANYPSAIQAYMVAADSKDSYIRSTALERLAECYIALNQFKDALRYLKQVLREDCDTMTRDNCVKLLHLVSEAIEDREPREKNEDK